MYSLINYFANSTTLEFTNLQTKQNLASKYPIIKKIVTNKLVKVLYRGFHGDLIIINDDTLS